MKKILCILLLCTTSNIAIAQNTLPDVRVSELCTHLEDAKLPGSCQLNCVIVGDPGSPKLYVLALTKKNQHTTLDAISSDAAERESVNGGTVHIFAGRKGSTPSLDLTADSNGTVTSLSINEVECK